MPPLDESTIEEAALAWFGELGYAVGHGPDVAPGEVAAERESFGTVVLEGRLHQALRRLNPGLPAEALEDALRKVLRVGTPSLAQTNRAFHRLLRDGVDVEYARPDGSTKHDKVWLIDFGDAEANDWLVVNQFTVIEGQHNRRPDLVVFVNGLPLGLVELKNAADADATIWSAYAQLQTYQAEIPSLLHYNAVLVVSDGLQARIGSLSANQEWFKVWRTIDGSGDAPKTAVELEVLVRGVFDPRRFLDLLQHFIVFEENPDTGALHKIIAGYHQFHAVNAAVEETVRASGMDDGTLIPLADGAFWSGRMRGGKHKNVAVELLEKLLRDELRVRSKRNLVESQWFTEKLKRALNAYHNRAIATQEVIEELIKLAQEMNAASRRGQELGLTEDERAFYDALSANASAVQIMGDKQLKVIAAELITNVRQSVTIDWTLRESARAKIRVLVKRILNKFGYPPDLQDEAVKTVLMQAELMCADWAA
jgi:type I site-specific restriction-modification system R (restriction) subunit